MPEDVLHLIPCKMPGLSCCQNRTIRPNNPEDAGRAVKRGDVDYDKSVEDDTDIVCINEVKLCQ